MDYVVIMCTPYSVRAGLVEKIVDDLSTVTAGREIMRKTVRLSRDDIAFIYPRMVNTIYFDLISECFTAGDSECIVLSGDGIHDRVNTVKGKIRFVDGMISANGLRGQYLAGEQRYEFFFHSTDSNNESDELGARFFGKEFAFADRPNE